MSNTEEEWVNRELHSLIGMSDDMTVSYVLSLANQMKDSSKVYQGLVDFDFPQTNQTKEFAQKLIQRTQPKPALNQYKEQELELAAQQRKNQKYGLVIAKSKKEDEQFQKERKLVARPTAQEKKRDIEERDAFEKRLRQKDEEKRKGIKGKAVGGIVPPQNLKDTSRDLSTYQAKKAVASKLREESRGIYAQDRVEKQIRRQELILKAQQEMFELTQLTKTEREVYQHQKGELELAKQMQKKKKEGKKAMFQFQESDQELTGAEKARRALKSRYVQEPDQYEKFAEQEGWERVQTG